MQTIDKDKYGHITLDRAKKCLRMDWLPAASEMTADDFKRSLTVAADAALAHSVESILVNVRDFRPNPALAEICEWRVQHIVPKYNQVIKRFAWLAAAQAPQLPSDGNTFQNAGEAYQSCWFRDEAAAISWATTNSLPLCAANRSAVAELGDVATVEEHINSESARAKFPDDYVDVL